MEIDGERMGIHVLPTLNAERAFSDFALRICENISKISEIFISKYNKNCFLDIHNDENKGKIAFILQLSKNFRLTDGGTLFFINHDNSIKNTFIPKFNTFIFFKIDDNSMHYVSAINNFSNKNRYAITGWFI